MICKNFDQLSLPQKWEMIGKIQHIIQTSNVGFNAVKTIIEAAEERGLFDDVKILPASEEEGSVYE